MSDLRLRTKRYAIGVITELQRFGYSEKIAKKVFLRHYRGLKRIYGFNMNVLDFAKVIDEIERSVNRKSVLDYTDLVYVGHTRDQLNMSVKKADVTGTIFRISEEMEQKIKEWDSCIVLNLSEW